MRPDLIRRLAALEIPEFDQTVAEISAIMDELSAKAAGGSTTETQTLEQLLDGSEQDALEDSSNDRQSD